MTEKASRARAFAMIIGIVVLVLALLWKRLLRWPCGRWSSRWSCGTRRLDPSTSLVPAGTALIDRGALPFRVCRLSRAVAESE